MSVRATEAGLRSPMSHMSREIGRVVEGGLRRDIIIATLYATAPTSSDGSATALIVRWQRRYVESKDVEYTRQLYNHYVYLAMIAAGIKLHAC